MGMVSDYPGLTGTNPNDIISHSHNNMHILSGKLAYKRLVLDLNHRSIMEKRSWCHMSGGFVMSRRFLQRKCYVVRVLEKFESA